MTQVKNKKPEQLLVVVPCLAWGKGRGFSLHQVESKSVFSKAAGRYKRGMTCKGMPDIIGCTPEGTAAFIEAKAPGKLSSLRPEQRDFLVEKIHKRCFAVCVDSARRLSDIYERWVLFPPSMGVSFLLQALPPEPVKRVRTLASPD